MPFNVCYWFIQKYPRILSGVIVIPFRFINKKSSTAHLGLIIGPMFERIGAERAYEDYADVFAVSVNAGFASAMFPG